MRSEDGGSEQWKDKLAMAGSVWERQNEFVYPSRPVVGLPMTSVVFETRPEAMGVIRNVFEWHRKWFSFAEEVVVSTCDPNIPGVRFVRCPPLPHPSQFLMWYSDFCIRWLNPICVSDFMLLWQWDGFIVNPDMWTDEFMRYDYVGGPICSWHWTRGALWLEQSRKGWRNPMRDKGFEGKFVGNGGFSLRSKRFLEESAKMPMAGSVMSYNEDAYLCVEKRVELEDRGLKFCPVALATRFAKDKDDSQSIGRCFGFHDAVNFGKVKKNFEDKYIPRTTVPVPGSPPASA